MLADLNMRLTEMQILVSGLMRERGRDEAAA